MRSLNVVLAVAAAVVTLGVSSARSEPVKIRMAWVAPVSNWGWWCWRRRTSPSTSARPTRSKRYASPARRR